MWWRVKCCDQGFGGSFLKMLCKFRPFCFILFRSACGTIVLPGYLQLLLLLLYTVILLQLKKDCDYLLLEDLDNEKTHFLIICTP